jgi:hypothetical protein
MESYNAMGQNSPSDAETGGKGKGRGKGKGKGKGKFRKGGKGKSDMFFGTAGNGDRLVPTITEADAKEARAIVVKAQLAANAKDDTKAKAAAASQEELQALINARLNLSPKKDS